MDALDFIATTYSVLSDAQVGSLTKAISLLRRGEAVAMDSLDPMVTAFFNGYSLSYQQEIDSHKKGPKKGCHNNPNGRHGKGTNSRTNSELIKKELVPGDNEIAAATQSEADSERTNSRTNSPIISSELVPKQEESLFPDENVIDSSISNPNSKEEKNKEKREKENESPKKTMAEREREFGEKVDYFSTTYPRDMLDKFKSYWTEHNPNGTKMRFEMEKTFDMGKRLGRWASNNRNRMGTVNEQQPRTSQHEDSAIYGDINAFWKNFKIEQ